jgi:hypothetical protein
MPNYISEADMKELDIEVLTNEGMELLRLELGELYAMLGAQLLGQNLPRRAAGIASYLSAIRSASEAKTFYQALSSENSVREWGRGVGVIYEELKQDGVRHIEEISPVLRKALCNEDILRLSDSATRSAIQIVVLVVGAALRMPREFDPISVTVSAILFKLGLRSFCRQGDGGPSEPPERSSR